jgi:tripartite-type tricarboxylate transporter receptor subunit TctC
MMWPLGPGSRCARPGHEWVSSACGKLGLFPPPLWGRAEEGSAPFTWQLLSIVMNRIRINLLATLVCCVLMSVAASAQSFPTRPIRLIVPFPPAGITDLSARLVAEGLRVRFNQPVIVENRPGANGLLGLREMLKAEPDGYTLMAGTVGNLVIGYAMEANPSFDALRDVVPIAGTAEYATAMVVNNKLPVSSVKEFIDYAKARPGKLTFGSTGTGALDYLAVELFMRATGTSMVHVPYRGGPAALNDLMGGSIDLLIEVFPVVMEQIKSGMIKGLAVSSPYRLPSVPDLPTFKQAGVGGVELTGWLGIYGPPRMPDEARATLGNAIVDIVKQPDVQDKFRAIGFEPTGLGVTEFSAFHEAEVKRWVAFMTDTGLRK